MKWLFIATIEKINPGGDEITRDDPAAIFRIPVESMQHYVAIYLTPKPINAAPAA